jgi:hypothetical protein
MAECTSNASTWEAEAGGSKIQGHPGLHNEAMSINAYIHIS